MLPLIRLTPFYQGQMGVPGSDVPLGVRAAGGLVIYLGATIGNVVASDVNDGTDPLNPKATLAGAYAAVTSGQGDVIVVLPGRYNFAATVTLAKSNLKIVGWDFWMGRRMPNLTIFDGNGVATPLTIDADGVEVAGIAFENVEGHGAEDVGIIVNSTQGIQGLNIHDCLFRCGLYGIQLGAGAFVPTDVLIHDNLFWLIEDTAANAAIAIVQAERVVIEHNFIYSEAVGAVFGIAVANVSTPGTFIVGNYFDMPAAATAISRAGATADAKMIGNYFSGGCTPITQTVDGGLCAAMNYNASSAGGVLVDATT